MQTLSLVRALDMPAREALLLARRHPLAALAPAVVGAVLIAGACLAAQAMEPVQRLSPLALSKIDLLRAVGEALAVVAPSAIIFATYVRIAVTPRTLLTALAIGMLTAGVVLAALVPTMAFLSIASRAQPVVSPALLFPVVALAAIGATFTRVVRSIDRSARARWLTFVFDALLLAVFGVRALHLL
jgi:hypothetical protein